MASTYSDLKIELIGTGEQSGTWGSTTNTNIGTAIEEAIVGRANANFPSDANLTLTLTNTNATQVARHYILNVTSSTSLTTTRNLIVPTIDKPYIVENNTTGGRSIVVKTAAGSGITVPNGRKIMIYANSVNVVSAFDYIPTATIDSLTLTSALGVTSGGTGANNAATARTNLGVTATGADTTYLFRSNNLADLTSVASARVNLGVSATGTDTTYAYRANNLSDLTNAATARTNLGLGSIATQAANNVNITGGVITGASITGVNLTSLTSLEIPSNATAVTQSVGDNSTKVATTAFVNTEIANDIGNAFIGSNQSLALPGYQKLPGGLIIQWGSGTHNSNVTFPIAFPNALLSITATLVSGMAEISLSNLTTTGFRMNTNQNAFTARYIAIGH